MSMEMRRKNYETKNLDNIELSKDKKISDIGELKRMIDELPNIDEEIINTYQKIQDNSKSDMDVTWIKEHEISEGKINLSSDKEDTDAYQNDNSSNVSNENVEKSDASLKFTEYVKKLMEKYNTNTYHRMMNDMEINRFVYLYSEAFNVDRREVFDLIEDAVKKQLNTEKSDAQIKKQGLEREKLMVLTQNYRNKFGNSFMAYLSDDELENYSIQYLRSFDMRRSDVDKMYRESLDNAYADAIVKKMENGTIDVDGNKVENEVEMNPSGKSMGFSVLRLLILIVFVILVIVGIVGLYFLFK